MAEAAEVGAIGGKFVDPVEPREPREGLPPERWARTGELNAKIRKMQPNGVFMTHPPEYS
jgi:hypothetical protein